MYVCCCVRMLPRGSRKEIFKKEKNNLLFYDLFVELHMVSSNKIISMKYFIAANYDKHKNYIEGETIHFPFIIKALISKGLSYENARSFCKCNQNQFDFIKVS